MKFAGHLHADGLLILFNGISTFVGYLMPETSM